MPPAGYMWPGGPPLPEWIQVGVRIVSMPDYAKRLGVRRKCVITQITEAYIHFNNTAGSLPDRARPEHFVANWQEDKEASLPRLWPPQRPSVEDINKPAQAVADGDCWKKDEMVLIGDTTPEGVYFVMVNRPGRPMYATTRKKFVKHFRSMEEIPWRNPILDDDPFDGV